MAACVDRGGPYAAEGSRQDERAQREVLGLSEGWLHYRSQSGMSQVASSVAAWTIWLLSSPHTTEWWT